MAEYELEDVMKSYRWLGHQPYYTELTAIHPEFKSGREHFAWNKEHNTLTKYGYAQDEKKVIDFVKKHAKTHMTMMSLNPRPAILKNQKGYLRASKESDIALSQNMLLDIDFIDKNFYTERLEALEAHIKLFDEYWQDHGIQKPVSAFTGRGYHFLFAYAPIKIQEHPDVSQRIKLAQDQFRQEFCSALEHLGAKVDHTHDLRRLLRVYGTAKPNVGVLSCFFGEERKKDDGFRKYLLGLNAPSSTPTLDQQVNEELPSLFQHLLKTDTRLQELYIGKGKKEDQDTSRSGFDFSIIKHLLNIHYSNLDDLMQVLRTRPGGAVRGSGKGEQYIRHTIANAIK